MILVRLLNLKFLNELAATAALGDPPSPDAVVAGGCGRPVGCRIGREWRLDARPGRIAMDMSERRLHAGHKLFTVEQFADRHRRLERYHVTVLPGPPTQVGVEIGRGRDAAREAAGTRLRQRGFG